jgi:hypothetical protein
MNLAMSELGFQPRTRINIRIKNDGGPLGAYTPYEPNTLTIDARVLNSPDLAHVVFHETKHLVDCQRQGYSDEYSPNPFASSLCRKYGLHDPSQGIPMNVLQGMQAPQPFMPQPMPFMPMPFPIFNMQPMPQCRNGFCVPRRW